DPGQVLAAAPAAGSAGGAAVAEAVTADQRLELVQHLLTCGGGKRRRVADVVEHALVVVEAQQQRADAGTSGRFPVAAHDAVDSALVLDLDHHPLPRRVGLVGLLGDHAVAAGALVLLEPGDGFLGVYRLRRQARLG